MEKANTVGVLDCFELNSWEKFRCVFVESWSISMDFLLLMLGIGSFIVCFILGVVLFSAIIAAIREKYTKTIGEDLEKRKT